MILEYASTESKRYSAIKTRIFVVDIILTVAALVVFQVLLARPLADFASSIHSNFYIGCFLFACMFLLFMYVVGFPLHFTSSFIVEKRFALSKQSLAAWSLDEAKSTVLSFILSMAAILVFYLVLRNFPTLWWVVTAVVWIFFSIVLARFLPILIIPLFYKYLPIEDSELTDRIMLLAEKAKVHLMDVCQIDFSQKTTKANAALVGLGKTRKVILADTLIEGFTLDEIEAVVAHEFAHFKYKHMWQLLAFSGITTLAGFFVLSLAAGKIVVFTGAKGLTDVSLLPALMLLMLFFGIVMLPLQNFFSRVLERQADKAALTLTANREAFISLMRKLADMNLADVSPSRLKKIFLYDHPPTEERINMAEGMKCDAKQEK